MAPEGDRKASQVRHSGYDGPSGTRGWESGKTTPSKPQDKYPTSRGVPAASSVKPSAAAAWGQAKQATPSRSGSGMQYLKSTNGGTPPKPSPEVSSLASTGGGTSSWAALLGGRITTTPVTPRDAAVIASRTSVAAQEKPQPEPAAAGTQRPEDTSSPCSPRSFSFQRGNGVVLVHEAGPLSPRSPPPPSPLAKFNSLHSGISAAEAAVNPSATIPPLSWAEKAKLAAARAPVAVAAAPFRKAVSPPPSNKQNTKAPGVTSPKRGQEEPRSPSSAVSRQQQAIKQQRQSISGRQRSQVEDRHQHQHEKTRATNSHVQPYSNPPSKKPAVVKDASHLLPGTGNMQLEPPSVIKKEKEKKEAEAADGNLSRPPSSSSTTAPEAPSSSALPPSADIKEALDILCSSLASWSLPSNNQTTSSSASIHQQQRVQPRGIKNPGNLCFVNAVLQGLMGSTSFCRILLALSSLSSSGEDLLDIKTYPVLSAMVNVAAEFQNLPENVTIVDKTSTINDANTAKNTNLVTVLGGQPVSSALILEIINQFTPRQQQHQDRGEGQVEQEDAHEFLHFLLDKMDSELVALRKVVKKTAEDKKSGENNTHTPPHREAVFELQEGSFENNDDDDGCWLVKSGKKAVRQQEVSTIGSHEAASVITALFQGKFATSVACAGAPNSVTVHPFMIVELPIYAENIRSVSESLDALTAAELLEDYKPAAGAIPQQAAKTERFLHVPGVLILHLMRFQYTGKSAKIGKFVAFEPRLSMKSSWMATGTPDRGAVYNLVATVTHHGKTISRGHYTADVVQPDGKWLRFDDSDVYWVNEQQVLSDTPYLLVYERQR
ncbi:hypothetical protein Ndes2526B_g02330 [Nannochloris sp. 'desiccata']|nr:hypothetical protein KSW81_003341 [Chlorella desiccata (nom. nud.)]